MSFISTKKEIYVHDDEHKDSLKVTIVRTKIVLKLKNGSRMHKK